MRSSESAWRAAPRRPTPPPPTEPRQQIRVSASPRPHRSVDALKEHQRQANAKDAERRRKLRLEGKPVKAPGTSHKGPIYRPTPTEEERKAAKAATPPRRR